MIADLKCTECGHIEERFYQSKQPVCNKCGGRTEKILSAQWSFNFGNNGRGTDMGLTTSYPSSYKPIKRG